MKNIIIGTAGHVDHGKTALIKALTGIETDRIKEEKKRGITIELGFAYLDLPDGEKAGIIDVPGHEKFVKNMLAGAGGIDLALLVIAADEGFMPQTREHLGILSLLNIPEGIIVITKKDMVDEDWLEVVCDDIRNEVKGTFLENAQMIPVSSYTGEGIEELKQAIFQLIDQKTQIKNLDVPFRIPIDRIFSVEGFGTVITGTLIEGKMKVGDPVTIYPNMRVNAIPQVGVVGDLLFPPYILEPKSQLVQHTLVVVQQRQAESRIVIRMTQCNKFSPHLTVSVQATQAGTAYKDRIMDHRPIRKQFAEFLLKKVAHLVTPLVVLMCRDLSGNTVPLFSLGRRWMDFDRLQGWLTKHIQVLCHGASDGGSVCSIWFIPIPLNCSIVDPNMRSDSIRKIRIVR